MPHPPQLFGSVLRFVQMVWPPEVQTVAPTGQAQAPETQMAPVVQVMPQPPQLLGSVLRSVQVVVPDTVHITFGAVQVTELQTPAVHAVPAGQTKPHAPQLLGLLLRSVQTPPHIVSPGEHVVGLHVPEVHAAPAGQTIPQPPQLLGSLLRLVQVVWPATVHITSGAVQVVVAAHTPPVQDVPEQQSLAVVHAAPTAPHVADGSSWKSDVTLA